MNATLFPWVPILVSRSSERTIKFFKTVDNIVAPEEALVVEVTGALFYRKDTLHDCSLQSDGDGALLNSLTILSATFKGPPVLHRQAILL